MSRPCRLPHPGHSRASAGTASSSSRSRGTIRNSAQVGTPTTDGIGDLLQGYLEASNVNSVTEIADLIAAQRAYEMNARVISGADEMMQSTTQMR